jgi:hypothetical protein
VCDGLEDGDLVAAEGESELSGAAHVDEPGAGTAVLVEQFQPDSHIAFVRIPVGRDGRSDPALVVDDLEPSRS